MPMIPVSGGAGVAVLDEELLAVVYADDEWLRAEFDALMTAACLSPPADPPRIRVGAAWSSRGRWTAEGIVGGDGPSLTRPRVGRDQWPRNRSPPARMPAPAGENDEGGPGGVPGPPSVPGAGCRRRRRRR